MFLQRILNKVVSQLGLVCVEKPARAPVSRLPEQYLQNARLLPSREILLEYLPQGGRVAEIGVAFGFHSRNILDTMKPQEFFAVDTFGMDHTDSFGRQIYDRHLHGKKHLDFYQEKFSDEIATGQVVIRQGYSHEVMETFPDASFDMIYVDAGHDYESVARDLTISGRKIKPEGYIVLNDYTLMDPLLLQPYGIIRATHEFCVREGWQFAYFALHPLMFCDVALKRL